MAMYCRLFSFVFLSLVCLSAQADSGIAVSATGKDLSDAQVKAVRLAIAQLNASERAAISGIIDSEIVPYAAQFVSSYKVTDTGKGQYTSIQTSIDADQLRSLIAINPKNLGVDEKVAKVLAIIKAPKLNTGKEDASYEKMIAPEIANRFSARHFKTVRPSGISIDQIALSDDLLSAEFLQTLGTKHEAQLVFAISASIEEVENENNHNKEERLFLEGMLVDVKKGNVLARNKVSALMPQGKREVITAALEAILQERIGELMQDMLVHAGGIYLKSSPQFAGLIVRIVSPQSAGLVQQFRVFLEGQKDIKSVLEHSVQRGAYDFAVSTGLDAAKLLAKLKSTATDGFTMEEVENTLGKPCDIALRLKAKQ